jgi:selenocysteine-specific elongation factor
MTARPAAGPEVAAIAEEPQVVATAGHVDHGKSALILRLTGIDPDRLAEEKRRGLTIDLGFAWATLPSGREIGFVDVPGHERFVRNMLAGVGPVRLVLFVVAADEGWKPQSEEHLAIVDVLGVHAGVVALTKRDLVDQETLDIAVEEVRERLAGTALEGAPIVPCSSVSGEGLDELRTALDQLVASAPPPEQDGRPRQFVDRVFSIRGAGTVVTGTLTGGPLQVGDEIEVYPVGARARIRGLQTHKRTIGTARPVSRVATNLVGVEREQLERGDVVGVPRQWRPTAVFEARVTPVRGLEHPLSARGAYKLYAGSAERDARIRFYPGPGARPDSGPDTGARTPGAFARVRLSAPVVLDVHERFVLREAGRRATVAGGVVLDTEPPIRPGPQPERRLAARERASREELPRLLVTERGAIRAGDLVVLVGLTPTLVPGARRAGGWWISEDLYESVRGAVTGALGRFHAEHPLREGAPLSLARTAAAEPFERAGRGADPGLVEAMVDDLVAAGVLHRTGSEIRLSSHRVALDERREEVDRLVAAVAAGGGAPPTVPELIRSGFSREVLDAAGRAGAIVRISPDIVLAPEFVRRAEEVLGRSGAVGITVSAFREELGTSRRFALPLLEWFDQRGVTRRQGDLRFLRKLD